MTHENNNGIVSAWNTNTTTKGIDKMKKLIIASGLNDRGEVIVKSQTGFGVHGYKSNWRKVQESKKGQFVIVDKKRVYIEVPTKGDWITFDLFDESKVSESGCGVSKWVGETIEIEY